MLEPANAEAHVSDLLEPDDLLDARAFLVPRLAKPRRERRRVLQVRALEPEPHHRDERRRIAAGRHARPEPVTHGEVADAMTELLDALGVHPHVPRLVERDPDQPFAELERSVGEREQRPRHELRGLELMVKERVQRSRSPRRRAKPARLVGARRHAELGRTSRGLEAARQRRCLPASRRRRRLGRELVLEARRGDVVPSPAFDRSCLRHVHPRNPRGRYVGRAMAASCRVAPSIAASRRRGRRTSGRLAPCTRS